MWVYIEGKEEDFTGAPDWATERVETDKGGGGFVAWVGEKDGKRLVKTIFYPEEEFSGNYGWRNFISAKRVLV